SAVVTACARRPRREHWAPARPTRRSGYDRWNCLSGLAAKSEQSNYQPLLCQKSSRYVCRRCHMRPVTPKMMAAATIKTMTTVRVSSMRTLPLTDDGDSNDKKGDNCESLIHGNPPMLWNWRRNRCKDRVPDKQRRQDNDYQLLAFQMAPHRGSR